MSRSYFERTWIAQEVLLSWNATVIIGTHRFPWRLLRNAALTTQKCFCLPIDRESLSYWRLVALAIFVERIWKGVAFTIIELLQQLHMSRCRDPRDMVYAVLGMIQYPHGAISKSQAVATGLPIPDYTKSIEQVYRDTAAAIITSNQDLALFFNIQVPRMRNISTMPTWAIDWSPSPEGWWHASNPKIEQVGAIKPLNAFQKNSFVRPVPHGTAPIFPATDTMPISVAGRVLTAPGLSLGDVVWTSNPLHVDGFVFSLVELQSSVNQRCGNSLVDKYITGEPMIQALCKTILMGTNDTEAKGRGYETSGPGGWTPMFESFFGVLVSNDMMKRRNEMEGIPEDLFRLMCIQQTGAGLFLSAAKSVGNQRVFQTGKAGLMGIAALDVKEGDRVVLLRGAYIGI